MHIKLEDLKQNLCQLLILCKVVKIDPFKFQLKTFKFIDFNFYYYF